jgi:HEAT repeat protein
MACHDEGVWIDLAAGRLRFPARHRAIRHLEECPECRRRHAAARALVAQGLPGLAAAEGLRPRDPEALRRRVFAAVEGVRSEPRRPRLARVALLVAPLAAAVVVAAVLGYRFLGERGWKLRLEEFDGAILVASGGEDLSRFRDRRPELRPGDLVLALPGAQARLHIPGSRSIELTGPAVAVVDFSCIHVLRGLALARAPLDAPLLVRAGRLDILVRGSAEIDARGSDPCSALKKARGLGDDIRRRSAPGRAAADAASPASTTEVRVHSLEGSAALGPGLPVLSGGLLLTVRGAEPWPPPLRGGHSPIFRSAELTLREGRAVAPLLGRSPDPVRSLALSAADETLEPWRRALAVWVAADLGDPRAARWVSALTEGDGTPMVVRTAALRTLVILGDTSALGSALADSTPAIAESAASLAVRDSSNAALLAAAAADAALSPLARAIAAFGLEETPSEVPLEVLLSIASDRPEGPATRVALALIARREGPAATAVLLAAAREGPPTRRAVALRHLAQRGGPEVAATVLAALAAHEPVEVREAALSALPWTTEAEVLVSLAAEALESPSPAIRSAAVHALFNGRLRTKDADARRSELLRSIFERSGFQERDLLRALALVDPGRETLLRLFREAADPDLRATALRGIVDRHADAMTFEELLATAEDPASPIRDAAYSALGRLWPDRVLDRLFARPGEAAFDFPVAALSALEVLTDPSPASVAPPTLLLRALRSLSTAAPSPLVRRRALELLAKLAPESPGEASAAAIAILESPESSSLVRVSAVSLFLGLPDLDERARRALDALLSDPDDVLSDRAAEVLLQLLSSGERPEFNRALEHARHSPDPALRADAVLRGHGAPGSAARLADAGIDPHPVVRLAALAVPSGPDVPPAPGDWRSLARRCIDDVPALGADPTARELIDAPETAGLESPAREVASRFVRMLYGLRAHRQEEFRREDSSRLLEHQEHALAEALAVLDGTSPGDVPDALRDLAWAGDRSVLDHLFDACSDADADVPARAAALESLRRVLGGRFAPVFEDFTPRALEAWWADRAFAARVPLFGSRPTPDR